MIELNAVGVDDDGSVYVAGVEEVGEDQRDFVTLKYDRTGKLQWKAWYDGPDSGLDAAVALAADDGVYVTGYSASKQSNPDFGPNFDWATVRYDAAGAEQWVMRFDGVDGRADRPVAIGRVLTFARPITENLFVAGVVREVDTGDDFGLIRYILDEPNQPEQAWFARMDGPGANVGRPEDMAVDRDGNVYVTGSVGGGELYQNGDRRYLTAKYSSSGEFEWSALDGSDGQFNQAFVLQIGGDGGPVVSGAKYSPQLRWKTIKYDASGVEQWSAFYVPPLIREPTMILLGPDESVVVASIGAVVRYRADGTEDWTSTGADVLAVDLGGFVYAVRNPTLVSALDPVTLTRRFPTGTPSWTIAFDESIKNVNAIVADEHGAVFVAASVRSTPSSEFDIMLAKYDSTGAVQWQAVDATEEADYSRFLVVDSAGSAVVVGVIGTGNTDLAILRFDAAGELTWRERFNGDSPGEVELGNTHDTPYGVTLDRFGDVYVLANSGYGFDNGFPTDLQLIKYRADGAEEWRLRYPGPDFDEPVGFGLDDAGDIYVSQWSRSTTSIEKIVTLKFHQSNLQTNAENIERWQDLDVGAVHPNPFSESGLIHYQIGTPSRVLVTAHNILGQTVAKLVDRVESTGRHTIEWFPGATLASGVYFVRFVSNGAVVTRRAVHVKG
jgi:hypothetical protein